MNKKMLYIIVGMMGCLMLQGCDNGYRENSTPSYPVGAHNAQQENKEENADIENRTRVLGLSVDQEFDSRMGVTASIKENAKKKGFEVIEYIAEGDSQTQNIQIMELIEMNVDAILVCAVDQDTIEEPLLEAKERGIPIVAFDRDLPNSSGIDAYVGPDSVYDGEICGEALLDSMKDVLEEVTQKDETIYVLELVGALNDQNGIDRSKGWNEAIETFPQIEVIQMPTDWDVDSAKEAVQNAFQAIPDIRAVFCSTDSFVPCVNEVLTNLELDAPVGEEGHIFVNGVNGSAEGYQAAVTGKIDGFMVMNLEEVGRIAVELAEKLMENEPVNKITLVESTYYTSGTAESNSNNIWGAQ